MTSITAPTSNKNLNLIRRKSASKLGSSPVGAKAVTKPSDRQKMKSPITKQTTVRANIEEDLLRHSEKHGKKRLERMKTSNYEETMNIDTTVNETTPQHEKVAIKIQKPLSSEPFEISPLRPTKAKLPKQQ